MEGEGAHSDVEQAAGEKGKGSSTVNGKRSSHPKNATID